MSSEAAARFVVLHAARVRGLVADDALARVTGLAAETATAAADALAAQGLIRHRQLARRSGWILTPEGKHFHSDQLADRRHGVATAVEAGYGAFLNVNGPFKELCTDWQLA